MLTMLRYNISIPNAYTVSVDMMCMSVDVYLCMSVDVYLCMSVDVYLCMSVDVYLCMSVWFVTFFPSRDYEHVHFLIFVS